MSDIRSGSSTLLIAALFALLPAVASAGTLYKWVDEEGNVHFGDALPPEAVKQEHSELSEHGTTLKSVDRAKSEQEVARQQAQKEREEQLKKEEIIRKREQAAFDRMLLDTYLSEEDIVRARDQKIGILEGTITLTGKSISTLEQTISTLKEDVGSTQEGTKQRDDAERRLKEAEDQLASFRRYVDSKRSEQDELRQTFAGYLERFRELKGTAAR